LRRNLDLPQNADAFRLALKVSACGRFIREAATDEKIAFSNYDDGQYAR